jgi:hypothetical protein
MDVAELKYVWAELNDCCLDDRSSATPAWRWLRIRTCRIRIPAASDARGTSSFVSSHPIPQDGGWNFDVMIFEGNSLGRLVGGCRYGATTLDTVEPALESHGA